MEKTGLAKARARLFLWLTVCVILPAGLLAGAEGALRAAGYGESTEPFIGRTCGGKRVFFRNKAFLQQFFAKRITPEEWEKPEFAVAAEKPADTVRIFVFGGSAAMGWPAYDYSFPRFLEVMLRTAYPETRFEVYNTAWWGVNSHAMRLAARACAALDPDLFLVYMGNNEVHGPFGLRTGFARTPGPPPLPVIRARLRLNGLRLIQLMRSLAGPTPEPAAPQSDGGYPPPDDPRLPGIYRNFRENLEDLRDAGTGAGARVILSTVGANLRHWSPSFPRHCRELSPEELARWDLQYEAGIRLQKEGRHGDALRAFLLADAIDDTHADLQFRLAQCLWETGDFGEARTRFRRSADLDSFDWVRAKTPINEAVAQAAGGRADAGVFFLDGAAALADRSPHGTPGGELFIDSCHLNPEGNHALAAAFFDAVSDCLPAPVRPATGAKPAPPSLEECAAALALSRGRLIAPLREVLRIHGQLGRTQEEALREQLQALEEAVRTEGPEDTMATLKTAADRPDADYLTLHEYASSLLARRSLDKALEQAQRLTSAFPFRRGGGRLLGRILMEMNRPGEAAQAFAGVTELFPDDTESHARLGAALQAAGRAAEAARAYDRALALDPEEPVALCGRAEMAALEGRVEEARRVYRAVIDRNVWAWTAYEKLRASYEAAGDAEGLLKAFGEIAAAHPDSPFARLFLGISLEKRGDLDAATAEYRKANDLDPSLQVVRICLSRTLAAQARAKRLHKDRDGALALFQEAAAFNPENPEARSGMLELAPAPGAGTAAPR